MYEIRKDSIKVMGIEDIAFNEENIYIAQSKYGASILRYYPNKISSRFVFTPLFQTRYNHTDLEFYDFKEILLDVLERGCKIFAFRSEIEFGKWLSEEQK